MPGYAATLKNYSPKIAVESLIVLELARQFNSKPNPDDDNCEIEYVSRLITASLWDARDIVDVGERVDAALESEERVRAFFEDEPNVHMVDYEIGEVLRNRPEVLDWTGAQRQSELNARARKRAAERAELRRHGAEAVNPAEETP